MGPGFVLWPFDLFENVNILLADDCCVFFSQRMRRELRTHLNLGRVRFISVPYLCVQVVRWSGVGHQEEAALVPQRLQGWSAHSVCGLCYLLVPGHPDTQRHLRGTAWPGHGPVHGEAITGFKTRRLWMGVDVCMCVRVMHVDTRKFGWLRNALWLAEDTSCERIFLSSIMWQI